MTFVLYQITEDALLRQMEVLDQHISRTSANSWGHKWAKSKLEYLWREYKLCRVIKEK